MLITADSRPSTLGNYPGLNPKDGAILRQWFRLHEAEYTEVLFNVRVGTGQDPGPIFPDEIRKMAIANTQKRIDAILRSGNALTIVEVKFLATIFAIGQITTYAHLYALTYPGGPTPRLLIVAHQIAPELDRAALLAGVQYEVVNAP